MSAPLLIPVVLIWCVAVAWSDWRRRRIPNALLAAGLTSALLGLWFQGQTLFGVGPLSCLAGVLAGLLLMLPLHALGILGAGDVKLFAVIGALVGPSGLVVVWLVASLLAGLHAWLWLTAQRLMPHRVLVPAAGAFGRLPYGLHLAAGVAWIALQPGWTTRLSAFGLQ